MNQSERSVRRYVTISLVLILGAGFLQPLAAKEVDLEATYSLASNGDLGVVMKLTTSMDLYQKMRQSVSNLYLLLRNLASQRAELEVQDKKADWDDAARSITLSYTALGMARNLGNHWEFDVSPQAEFSNLDEDQRTVYFTEEVVSPLGKISGRGKLILPAAAQQYKWDPEKRVVSYVMPVPKTSSGRKTGLLVLAGLLFILGAVAVVASLARKSGFPNDQPPPDSQLPSPPKLLNE
jgi:hypothetical protein